MRPVRTLRALLAADRWQCALVGGLVALPFTARSYWLSGTEIEFSAVLFGGLLAGFLYAGDREVTKEVGAVAGMVGAAPVLWPMVEMLVAITQFGSPLWFGAVQAVAAVGFAGIGLVLSALAGSVSAMVGGWVASRIGRRRRPAVVGQ